MQMAECMSSTATLQVLRQQLGPARPAITDLLLPEDASAEATVRSLLPARLFCFSWQVAGTVDDPDEGKQVHADDPDMDSQVIVPGRDDGDPRV